jgi:hypothetical protein
MPLAKPSTEEIQTMKVLTFKRLIGLAAIGGLAYAHKQRGGQWTVASIKDTLKHLWSSALDKLSANQDQREHPLERGANQHGSSARNRSAAEYKPASYGDAGKREDETGRH